MLFRSLCTDLACWCCWQLCPCVSVLQRSCRVWTMRGLHQYGLALVWQTGLTPLIWQTLLSAVHASSQRSSDDL